MENSLVIPSYKLTIYEEENIPLITLNENEITKYSDARVALISLEINKEMYKPGKITVVLQFTDCNNGIIESLNQLLGKKVDLHDGTNTDSFIAKDYVLCDFEPEFRASNGTDILYVKLSIFSPEQLLTYHKGNACYVATKLGNVFGDIATNAHINFSKNNLQHLKSDITSATASTDGSNKKELIQPYMVQFEESPVDFLARMANRCGEFLFFENGEWQLGAEPTKATKVIDKYVSLSYHKFTAQSPQTYSISNYAKKKETEAEIAQKAKEQKQKEQEDRKNQQLEEYKKTNAYQSLTTEEAKEKAEKDWSDNYDKDLKDRLKNAKNAKKDALQEFKNSEEYKKRNSEELASAERTWKLRYDRIHEEDKKKKLEEYKETDAYQNLTTEEAKEKALKDKKQEIEAEYQNKKKEELAKYKASSKYTERSEYQKECAEAAWIEEYDSKQKKEFAKNEYKASEEYKNLNQAEKTKALDAWEKAYDTQEEEKEEEETLQKAIQKIQYAGPSDEYLEPITKKDGNWWGSVSARYWNINYYFKKLPVWLKQDNLAKMVAKGTTEFVTDLGYLAIKKNDKANEYNETFFNHLENQTEQISNDLTRYPLTSEFGKKKYSSNFYCTIEEHEKESERLKIHVKLGTYYTSLHLGDVIQIRKENFLVTKLSNIVKADEDGITSGLEIDAVPIKDKKCYPCPLPEGTIKKSEPQLATVTSIDDPMQMGRIQICYPWQNEDENCPYSSPWIRISAACTTDGGGLKFMPQEGDEIMVGYENGNIERPYMIGSLPTKATKGVGEDYMLQSPNGQYIKFDNSSFSYEDLLATFVPAYNVVTQFMPQGKIAEFGDMTKYGGGIEIGDKLGLYKVSMSSADRAIAIKSTWGDVNIDAFTGITISAPNGDIKIAGKNVTITAGNELTLKSGTNASKKRTFGYTKREFGSMVAAAVANKVSDVFLEDFKLDLSLLRMIAECFAKPIGGTMLIKSARFMRLEAGKGKTELPMGVEENEDRDEARTKEVIAYNTIKAANNAIDNILSSVHATIKAIESCKKEYGDKINELKETASSNSSGFELQYKGQKFEEDLATSEDFKFDKILEDCKNNQNYKVDDAIKNLDKLTLIDKQNQTEHQGFKTIKDSFKKPLGILIEKVHKQQAVTVSDKEKKDLVNASEPNYKTTSSLHEKENMSADAIKKMHNTILAVFDAHKTKIDFLIKLDAEKIDMESIKKLKRHIAYDILQKLKEKKIILVQDEKDFISTMNILFKDNVRKECNITEDVCEKDEDWDKFLGCIQAYDEEKDVNRPNWEKAKTIGMAIVNHLGWEDLADGWKENQVTDPKVKGEILMSDSSGNTVNINGTTIRSDASTLIPKLIAELKGI